MLIELRYYCYIHACSGNYLENIFPLYFLSFSDFCVMHRDSGFGTSGRWSCMSGRFFWLSGRYGWFIWMFILLVRTSVFLRPLCGTTSGRHLSYVRTVNPVGLNRILPVPQPIFSLILVHFCRLVHCLCAFYA
jgi:hypothetical protein